ncbi:DotU family type IV/VI secretion system protein [Janthinobacterium aquaticum]|uniref:DotU family type IV/VI secretion system protein n=1 Tax=Janthinobacterium sp. FT58W TaxID=2654254 RepID=UPI00126583B7|nr:DotU family type IV/VI secretion system protein [Janthinobacterium sp. FT58W]KAB8044245.1 DotU family type IV/VI secretion system protein [Janthinobacterium sp. FT58W]
MSMQSGAGNAAPAPAGWRSAMSEGVDLASIQFRDFYEVLALSAQAATRLSEAEARPAAEALSRKLCQLIELQTLEARRIGGKSGIEAEVQGRFLKAALADEVLLNIEWAGRTYWRHVLVEATLFKSSFAGERVFHDLDQLLRDREASRRNLGRLYLYLLSLGFQGRFRGLKQDKIAEYRRELFQFVYQRPADLQGRDRTLSEQAYASTLSHLTAGRMPRFNRTGLIALLAFLMLLGLSELLWLWQSWPVRSALAVTL